MTLRILKSAMRKSPSTNSSTRKGTPVESNKQQRRSSTTSTCSTSSATSATSFSVADDFSRVRRSSSISSSAYTETEPEPYAYADTANTNTGLTYNSTERNTSPTRPPADDFWNMDLDDIIHGPQKQQLKKEQPQSKSSSSTARRVSIRTPRRVRFDAVSVCEYNRILAINPACEEGPSLSIGWKVLNKRKCAIDRYETERQNQGRSICASVAHKSDSAKAFLLTQDMREAMAKDWGYSEDAIFENTVKVGFFQKLRNETLMELHQETLKGWESGSKAAANKDATTITFEVTEQVAGGTSISKRRFRKLDTLRNV